MEGKKTYLKIKFGGGNKELIDDGYNWTIDVIQILQNASNCIETVLSRENFYLDTDEDRLFLDVGITSASSINQHQSQSNHPVLYFNCAPIRTILKSDNVEIFSVSHSIDLGYIEKNVSVSVDMSLSSIPRFMLVKSKTNIVKTIEDISLAIDFISDCFAQNILNSVELIIDKEVYEEEHKFRIYLNIVSNNATKSSKFDIIKSKYSPNSIGKDNLKRMRKVSSAIIDTKLLFEEKNPNLIIPPLSVEASHFVIGLNSIVFNENGYNEDIRESFIEVGTNGQMKGVSGEYMEFYSKTGSKKIDTIYAFRNQHKKNKSVKTTQNNFPMFTVHKFEDIMFLREFMNSSHIDEVVRISFIYMPASTKSKISEEYNMDFHVSFIDAGFDKNISIVYLRSNNSINELPSTTSCLNDFQNIYEQIFSAENFHSLSVISPDDNFDSYMKSVFVNSYGLASLYDVNKIVSAKFPTMKKDNVDYFASPGMIVKRVSKNVTTQEAGQ